MKKTEMTGQTCVGDLMLSVLDVGYDVREVGQWVLIPDDFESVGLTDREGRTWLIEGTREEMIAAIREAGYEVFVDEDDD